MPTPSHCPSCGAVWNNAATCQDAFHQMLYWEAENPTLGEVHHLMVLCYHLQHPNLYSKQGLEEAKHLLAEFVEGQADPQQIRLRSKDKVDSGKRKWKIKASVTSQGAYEHPVQWSMTALDVVAGGKSIYRDNVRQWAWSILEQLKYSRNY